MNALPTSQKRAPAAIKGLPPRVIAMKLRSSGPISVSGVAILGIRGIRMALPLSLGSIVDHRPHHTVTIQAWVSSDRPY